MVPPDKYSNIEDIEEAHWKFTNIFLEFAKLAATGILQVRIAKRYAEALAVIRESQVVEFKRECPP